VVFGPVLDETGSWGLGVVESAEEDALRTIAQTDPVVTTRTATIEMGWSEHFSARASVRHRFCVSIVECRKGNGRRSGDVSVKGDRAVVDCGAVAVCDEVGWVTIGEGDEPTYLIVLFPDGGRLARPMRYRSIPDAGQGRGCRLVRMLDLTSSS